jgi:amino acid transporter
LGIAILFAIISGINGFMLASSRLLLAMARAKALPQAFGKIHPVHADAVCFDCFCGFDFDACAVVWP